MVAEIPAVGFSPVAAGDSSDGVRGREMMKKLTIARSAISAAAPRRSREAERWVGSVISQE